MNRTFSIIFFSFSIIARFIGKYCYIFLAITQNSKNTITNLLLDCFTKHAEKIIYHENTIRCNSDIALFLHCSINNNVLFFSIRVKVIEQK